MGSAYTTELWAEYGIGMGFFFLRFFARFKVVGLGALAWDDFFSFLAMILWTVDAVTVQIINDYGSFVGLNEQTAAALSDDTAARLKVGSKALFVAWISYVTLIWSLKASLLFFYSRLTLGLWQQKFVKIMAIASFLAYAAVMLTLFVHCTPIQKNWQIKPYAGDKCTLTVTSYIMVAALNVLTDAGILAIPMPLIWKVKIPLRRKIVIASLLSSGIFVITAALLRCILTLANANQIGNSTIWGIRETFVSLIAVSAPAIKPLFNKNRWVGSSGSKAASSGRFRKFGRNESSGINAGRSFKGNDIETGRSRKLAESEDSDVEMKGLSRTGSEERIFNSASPTPLKINVTTVYALNDEEEKVETSYTPWPNNENPAGNEMSNPFGSKPMSRTERWGSTTQITVGEGRDGQRSGSKASKMLGMEEGQK